ncbi:hypothetical protein BGZ98_002119 [Dissophora globulifera]|nr:hypothetical protein BGZ98_002119 [Dissophora globulifera]
MPLPELRARLVATFLICVILGQLVLYHRESLKSSSVDPPFFGQQVQSRPQPRPQYHPVVPLTVEDFVALDELADSIARIEAYRVFRDTGVSHIRGTSVTNNTEDAKRIRDQILCWTQHGSWVRQDESQGTTSSWITRKHLGHDQYAKCDVRFMEGLDRLVQENPDYERSHLAGEYDPKNERYLVREAVKYKWVPDESICGPGPTTAGLGDERATYQPFDKNAFCDSLGQRNILIAGDLTQYQLHDSILSAIGEPFLCQGELGCLPQEPHPLCRTSNLKFARNDVLSVPSAFDEETDYYSDGSAVKQPWATPELMQQYSIVLLNRGLLWKPDEEFLQELVFTMKHFWIYYPNTVVIYRATHPVANCTALKEQREDEAIRGPDGESIVPGTTLLKPLTVPPSRMDESEDSQRIFKPSLADVQRQNKLAKVIVESAGGIFLDTEEMFALRPDGRMGEGDCSRFCAPGPLDSYADLLFNTMRILPI